MDKCEKENIMRALVHGMNIDCESVVAIGDGANDLDLINTAGIGIAWNSNLFVQRNVKNIFKQLSSFFLGFVRNEWQMYGPSQIFYFSARTTVRWSSASNKLKTDISLNIFIYFFGYPFYSSLWSPFKFIFLVIVFAYQTVYPGDMFAYTRINSWISI